MPTSASGKAEEAGDSASLELAARAGLIAYGVVHLLRTDHEIRHPRAAYEPNEPPDLCLLVQIPHAALRFGRQLDARGAHRDSLPSRAEARCGPFSVR